VRVNRPAGPVTVSIAQIESSEDFVHAVLGAFVCDIAWLIPVVAALTLLIAVFSLRQGLRPLREVSAQARRISPPMSACALLPSGFPLNSFHRLVR
jgi:hypothetical protein